jgi:hypothetical protein
MEIIFSYGAVVGAFSFTTGFVSHTFTTRPMKEDDVMATALWLEKHGHRDEGELLLDRWCAGFTCYFR